MASDDLTDKLVAKLREKSKADIGFHDGDPTRAAGMYAHAEIRALLARISRAPITDAVKPVAWRWKQRGRTDVDAWQYQHGHPQLPAEQYDTEPVFAHPLPQGEAVPVATDTVFAWAWTLFGNGSIWQRRLTFTKDDPFTFDVSVSPDSFTSVPIALYTHPSPQAVCRCCKGSGTIADYVGDDMRCVEVECPACKGHPLGEAGDTDELVERAKKLIVKLRDEMPKNALGNISVVGLAELNDDAAGMLSEFTYALTSLRAERDEAIKERDEWQEELGKVIMACPMRPDMRMHPPSQGVRNLRTAFEAAESSLAAEKQRVEELAEQLGFVTGDKQSLIADLDLEIATRKASEQRVVELTAALTEAKAERDLTVSVEQQKIAYRDKLIAAAETQMRAKDEALNHVHNWFANSTFRNTTMFNEAVALDGMVVAALAPVTTPPALSDDDDGMMSHESLDD